MHLRFLMVCAALACVVACGGEDPDAGSADAVVDDVADTGSDVIEDAGDDAPDIESDVTADAGADPSDVDDAADASDSADEPDIDLGPPLGETGEWGPATRLVYINTPDSAQIARREGCLVFGENVGSSLSSLFLLAGGTRRFLIPNPDAEIDVVSYFVADGWEQGETVGQAGPINLWGVNGPVTVAGDPWRIDPETSFVESDPARPRNAFTDLEPSERGWFESRPISVYHFNFSLLDDFVVDIPLDTATLTGQLSVGDPGMVLENGVLTGYLTYDALSDLALNIQATCTGPPLDPEPALCNLIGGQIDADMTAEEMIDLVLGFTTGFDVAMEGGVPRTCDPEEEPEACNAFSVCLLLTGEGVAIEGLAE